MNANNSNQSVVILLSGGVIKDVYTNADLEVIILDCDLSDANDDDCTGDPWLLKIPSEHAHESSRFVRAFLADTVELSKLPDDCADPCDHARRVAQSRR